MENSTSCPDQRWSLPNSSDNAVAPLREEEEEEDDEEEEALSLSDLPLIHQSRKDDEDESTSPLIRETQDDFDFCSFSKESEMCTADQVFFRGQILPLRHSISGSSHYSSRSISRSESMDHCFSGRLVSSRSSSISSHQSSSSATSSSAAAAGRYIPKLPPRNSFHSYPSPSPRLHFSTHNQRTTSTNSNHRNSVKIKSSVWNVLRLGLVTSPPEMAFRSGTNCTNFGSRNSTSSNGSSMASRTKKKGRGGFLGGGCKCSADAVDTVASKVVIIKRSASENDVVEALHHRNVGEAMKKQAAKKQMSHHRTFEWLKQLSVVDATSDEA